MRREAKREAKLSEIARESLSTTSRALKISVRLTGGSDSVRPSSPGSAVDSEPVDCESSSVADVRVSELVGRPPATSASAPPFISRCFYRMRCSDSGFSITALPGIIIIFSSLCRSVILVSFPFPFERLSALWLFWFLLSLTYRLFLLVSLTCVNVVFRSAILFLLLVCSAS